MRDKSKQVIVRQLSSCFIEKYSGFTVISIEHQKSKENCLNRSILSISQQSILK